MNVDELKACILALRERRESLPALRDYRPQRKGGTSTPSEPVVLDNLFGGLFAKGAAAESESAAPEVEKAE